MAEWIKLLRVQTGNTEALWYALTLEAKAVPEYPVARVADGAMFSLCFSPNTMWNFCMFLLLYLPLHCVSPE